MLFDRFFFRRSREKISLEEANIEWEHQLVLPRRKMAAELILDRWPIGRKARFVVREHEHDRRLDNRMIILGFLVIFTLDRGRFRSRVDVNILNAFDRHRVIRAG